MSSLTLPAPRCDFIDPRTGKVAREWVLFFQQSFERLGGSDAESITVISAAIREILAALEDNDTEMAFSDAPVAAMPDAIEFAQVPAIDADAQEPTDYAAQIAELTKRVDELQNQIALLPDPSAQVGELRKRVKNIATPSVAGSRAANAALASLLTSLASYGLITDSTTV